MKQFSRPRKRVCETEVHSDMRGYSPTSGWKWKQANRFPQTSARNITINIVVKNTFQDEETWNSYLSRCREFGTEFTKRFNTFSGNLSLFREKKKVNQRDRIRFLFLFFDFTRKYTGKILRKIRENNLGIRNLLVTICFYWNWTENHQICILIFQAPPRPQTPSKNMISACQN